MKEQDRFFDPDEQIGPLTEIGVRPRRQLRMRLTQRGCDSFRWHCHKRKKLPIIDLQKREFLAAVWPGAGLMWQTAVEICDKARRVRGHASLEIECGEYTVTAYWANGEIT